MRLHLWLVALLACGLIAAGCGDDDDNESADDSPATTESAPPAETTEDTATTEEIPETEEEVEEAVSEGQAQAAESCKEYVRQSTTLSDDVKSDLEEICEEAATGDPEDLREASVEVCKKVVEDSVPAGPAREQAIETCDTSIPTP